MLLDQTSGEQSLEDDGLSEELLPLTVQTPEASIIVDEREMEHLLVNVDLQTMRKFSVGLNMPHIIFWILLYSAST